MRERETQKISSVQSFSTGFKIYAIKNARGEWMETREEIETTLNLHFTNTLFEPRQDRRENIEQITRLIPSLVTHEQNDLLIKPITLNEVEEAIF